MTDIAENKHMVYLIRHGETEWARSGRHTGRTDIPLTDVGRGQAAHLLPIFEGIEFKEIFSSPLKRALETAQLAGVGDRAQLDPDLMEWDYGDYEGLTKQQITDKVPGWTIWTLPCPNGELIGQIAARADRAIARIRAVDGHVAVFAHGHLLRVFVSRWLGQDPSFGRFFALDTSTLSVLGFDKTIPLLKTWNGPLITAACAVPWS
jgi:broad specificity phosphatase PhoE